MAQSEKSLSEPEGATFQERYETARMLWAGGSSLLDLQNRSAASTETLRIVALLYYLEKSELESLHKEFDLFSEGKKYYDDRMKEIAIIMGPRGGRGDGLIAKITVNAVKARNQNPRLKPEDVSHDPLLQKVLVEQYTVELCKGILDHKDPAAYMLTVLKDYGELVHASLLDRLGMMEFIIEHYHKQIKAFLEPNQV